MDRLSLIGFFLALAALVGGSILKGAGLVALWSPAAFVIVIIGTLAAIMVHTAPAVFKRAMKIAPWVVRPPVVDRKVLLDEIVEWSNLARRQGLLGLETLVEQQSDPFVRKGLQLLVDGVEPEALRKVMEIDLGHQEERDIAAAKVFEAMGIYSPTMGIVGAVLGLISVMKNLEEPSKLGLGISAAFTATIYGIGLANLALLPMANKLKSVIGEQTMDRQMLIDGLIAIAQGENPRNIETQLSGYLG